MHNPHEPQEPPLILPPKPAPAAPPPSEIWTPHAPGIERNRNGQFRTVPPLAAASHFAEAADEDLPDGLTREADGRLTYRCPRCERHDAEYFGDDPADFDPTFPCGGSQWCLP